MVQIESNEGRFAHAQRTPQNPMKEFLLEQIYRTHNGENADPYGVKDSYEAWLRTEGRPYHMAMIAFDNGFSNIRNLVSGDIVDVIIDYLKQQTVSPEFSNEMQQVVETLKTWSEYVRLTPVQLIDSLRSLEVNRISSINKQRAKEASTVVENCVTLEMRLLKI